MCSKRVFLKRNVPIYFRLEKQFQLKLGLNKHCQPHVAKITFRLCIFVRPMLKSHLIRPKTKRQCNLDGIKIVRIIYVICGQHKTIFVKKTQKPVFFFNVHSKLF